MNREQKTRFRDRHLRYQYDLLHCLHSVTQRPDSLSGLYLKKFYNATKRYQLTLPTQLTDPMGMFCTQCGVVRVAGVNMEMERHVGAKGKGSSLTYKCLYCSKSNDSMLGPELAAPQPIATATSGKNSRSNTPISTGKVSKPGNNNSSINNSAKAKARAKKRKNNSLSNLLSQKNKENKKKNSGILSLESFMQK